MPTKILKMKCNDCGICVYQCGSFVYDVALNNEKVNVKVKNAKDCVECLICVERCPKGAIELYLTGDKYFLD